MLSLYEPYEEFFDTRRLLFVPLKHLASELSEEYGYTEKEDLENALEQAFELCLALDIPIDIHFKKVYISKGNNLFTDWLLSDLGSYLLLINGSAGNPVVAQARLYVYKH